MISLAGTLVTAFCLAPIQVGAGQLESVHGQLIDPIDTEIQWGSERRSSCGINAVFSLANLSGLGVTMSKVENELPPKINGNSLLEMSRACGQIGLKVKALKCEDVATLEHVELPFIAHTQMSYERAGVTIGHYIVVYGSSNGRVQFLDPTTCRKYDQSEAEFFQRITGQVLAPYSGSVPSAPTLILLTALVAAIAALVMKVREENITPRSKLVIAALVATLCESRGLCGNKQIESEIPRGNSESIVWRTDANAIVNAAYFAILYFDCPDTAYEEVADSIEQRRTFASIAAVISRFGASARVGFGSLDTVASLGLPAIVEINDPMSQATEVGIVLAATGDSVWWMLPGPMRFVETPRSEFNRIYGGHFICLSKEASRSWNSTLLAALFGASLVCGSRLLRKLNHSRQLKSVERSPPTQGL